MQIAAKIGLVKCLNPKSEGNLAIEILENIILNKDLEAEH